MENNFEIKLNYAKVDISSGKHPDLSTEIDIPDLEMLLKLDCYLYVFPSRHQLRAGVRIRKKKGALLHRFLLNAPANLQVDHIDHNPLNNRRSNLRLATQKQNGQNMSGARSDSGTHVRGVSYRPTGIKRYVARVQVDGKQHHLGRFETLKEAEWIVKNFRAIHMPFSEERRLIENPSSIVGVHTPGIKNKSCGVKGITRLKSNNKYMVQICRNNNRFAKAGIPTLEEAIEIRNNVLLSLGVDPSSF